MTGDYIRTASTVDLDMFYSLFMVKWRQYMQDCTDFIDTIEDKEESNSLLFLLNTMRKTMVEATNLVRDCSLEGQIAAISLLPSIAECVDKLNCKLEIQLSKNKTNDN